MTKGYGNINPRFAKYFARHKNSSGPHDPKNCKQQGEAEAAIKDMRESLDALYEAGPALEEEFKVYEIFDVGEKVRVVSGEHSGSFGRVVMRRQDEGDLSYGVVFDWDLSMLPVYYTGNDLERDNG